MYPCLGSTEWQLVWFDIYVSYVNELSEKGTHSDLTACIFFGSSSLIIAFSFLQCNVHEKGANRTLFCVHNSL